MVGYSKADGLPLLTVRLLKKGILFSTLASKCDTQQIKCSFVGIDGGFHVRIPAMLACSFHRCSFTPNTSSHRIFAPDPSSPRSPMMGNRRYPSGGYRKLSQPTPP